MFLQGQISTVTQGLGQMTFQVELLDQVASATSYELHVVTSNCE